MSKHPGLPAYIAYRQFERVALVKIVTETEFSDIFVMVKKIASLLATIKWDYRKSYLMLTGHAADES